MLYYEYPTQVMFYRNTTELYSYGIAFKDTIIDGLNGDIYKIKDIEKPIYDYEYWVDLTGEIYGGVYPKKYSEKIEKST